MGMKKGEKFETGRVFVGSEFSLEIKGRFAKDLPSLDLVDHSSGNTKKKLPFSFYSILKKFVRFQPSFLFRFLCISRSFSYFVDRFLLSLLT